MAEAAYDVQAIEAKWQARWRDEGTYEVDNDDPRPHFYALACTRTRRAPAHMGHVRNYTFGDLIVRYRTMNGLRGAVADGVRQLRPAGRERRDQDRRAPPGVHRRAHRGADAARSAASARSTTGAARSRATTPTTSAGPSGSSCGSSRPAWPTASNGAGQLVPRLPDGAGQRAGAGRRHLRALGRRRREARPRAVVLQDHRLRRSSCSTTSTTSTGPSGSRPCSATGSAGPRAPSSTWRSRRRRRTRPATASAVFTTRPDTSFGMTYVRPGARAPAGRRRSPPTSTGPRSRRSSHAARDTSEVDRLSSEGALDKRGVFTGAYVRQPVHRRSRCRSTSPTTCSMGYGTGAIMAVPGQDQRDWDFADGATTCRSSAPSQPPDGWEGEAYTGDGPAINSEWLDGLDKAEAIATAIDWLEERGHRRAQGQLPPARLAAVPAALLGLPDPDRLLPRPRHRAGARRPAARCWPPTTSSSCPTGESPLQLPRGLPAHDLPDLRRARPSARPTRWTPSSTRPGTSCASADPWNGDAPFSHGRPSAAGCRSTSTSAASSTPSST